MKSIRMFLDRLWPVRRRRRVELDQSQRLALWANIADTDNCLRAVEQLLDDLIENNARHALSADTPPERVELYRLRAGVALEILGEIEREREMAKEQSRVQSQESKVRQ